MSTSDVDGEQHAAAQSAEFPTDQAPGSPAPAAPQGLEEPEEREPIVTVTEREVTIQRSVRYGRILIAGVVLGAVIGMLASTLFPIEEDAEYTLGQVIGFMALIGAAIGLALAGVLSLILGAAAKRSRGTGVAIQSDVQ